jgi:polar amino acid transport system ATP-binding protein
MSGRGRLATVNATPREAWPSADDELAPVMVRVSNVAKRFGQHQVLRDVSFEIGRGQTVAIIGASGSGKTTMLRCLNRLEEISSGEVSIDGKILQRKLNGRDTLNLSARDLRAFRRDIGIVFQQYNLFPHLSVIENVVLAPIGVLRQPSAAARENGHALLAKVGLAHKAASRPGQLSGGEQQRVAIARALAMNPKLILFDEVTSALDPLMTGEVLAVMKGLADDGLTMVVVTHEMGFARHVANEVLFMADGEIVERGAAAELFDNPREERTQRFMDAILHPYSAA